MDCCRCWQFLKIGVYLYCNAPYRFPTHEGMTPGKAADFTLVSIDAMGGTGRDGENNMNIENAEIYLKKNGKKLLTGGKSRARVYDIGGRMC